MNPIILNEEQTAQLNGAGEHLEIRDASGKRRGWFIPEEEYMRELYAEAHAELDRLDAEDAAKGIVRKWDGTNGKTTGEVLANLRKLKEQLEAGQ